MDLLVGFLLFIDFGGSDLVGGRERCFNSGGSVEVFECGH